MKGENKHRYIAHTLDKVSVEFIAYLLCYRLVLSWYQNLSNQYQFQYNFIVIGTNFSNVYATMLNTVNRNLTECSNKYTLERLNAATCQ